MTSTISYQTALIYTMVVAAVADGELKDSELVTINETVKSLPIFHGYNYEKLTRVTGDCAAMLDQEEGIDAVLGLIKEALPAKLTETAFALACCVIAADGNASQEELQWLELLAKELHVSQLSVAAIEHAVRAFYIRYHE